MDYKSMRLKKNENLLNAMENVRKDLYDWKPVTNVYKINKSKMNSGSASLYSTPPPSQRLKSIIEPSGLNLILKRSDSLKDLNRTKKISKIDNDFGGSEFLKNFQKKSNSDLNEEKIYLNSSRRNKFKNSKNSKDLEFVQKELNKTEPQNDIELDLSQTGLCKINNLQQFKNLKILDLSCNKIKKLENLNFKNLIELRLFANQIEILENFENVQELQSLQVQANRIKKLGKSLNTLKKLEYLRLDQNELNSISSSEMSGCVYLIYLNVSHNNLISISFINVLPNLEELDASFLSLKRIDDVDPSRCRRLAEIDLSSNELTDDSLSSLIEMTSLTTLKLSNNQLKSVDNLSNIKSLRDLDISNNQIKLINLLTNLKDLETLDISTNEIDDWFQIETLVKCVELVELNLVNNPIMKQKTLIQVSIALPNLQLINDTKINRTKNEMKIINEEKLLTQDEDFSFMKLDFNRFENEVEMFNEKFNKKFNEIKEYMKNIEIDDAEKNPAYKINYWIETKPALNSANSNENRPISSSSRKASKSRLLDALSFSKQLGDKTE